MWYWSSLIETCAALGTMSAAAQLVAADDLFAVAAQARARRVPVLIAFMQKSCPYCAVARRDYLTPLQHHPQWKDRVLIREIDIESHAALRDFSGAVTTTRDFARAHAVRRVPTLIAFDADGEQVYPPIVGLLGEDFYPIYIEQAIEAGLAHMRRQR